MEKMIDKVLKLLSKAESTTPEEAEALIAKAQEIMTRHTINEAMLAAARGEQEPDEIIEHRITLRGTYAQAHQSLALAVARGAGFRVLVSNYSKTQRVAYWIGYKSEIERQEVLFTSLLIQAERALRVYIKAWNADHAWASPWERQVTRRSFLNGFAAGIQRRLVAARREAEQAAEEEHVAAHPESTSSSSTPGVALVLASRRAKVDDWMDKRYGKLRSSRGRAQSSNYNAAAGGREAAARANLNGTAVRASKGALSR